MTRTLAKIATNLALMLLTISCSRAAMGGNIDLCLAGAVESAAYDSQVYQCGDCWKNVISLLGRLRATVPNFDVSKAEVLYLIPSSHGLRGLNTRRLSSQWEYHVVISYDGKIIDLDAGGEGWIMDRADYFHNMFFFTERDTLALAREIGLTSLDNPQIASLMETDLKVRRIPATVYVDAFQGVRSEDEPSRIRFFMSQESEAKYPSQSFSSFLGSAWNEIRTRARNLTDSGRARTAELSRGRWEVDSIDATNPRLINWYYNELRISLDLTFGVVRIYDDMDREVFHPPFVRLFLEQLAYRKERSPEIARALLLMRENRAKKAQDR
jgi:hypothetical protein